MPLCSSSAAVAAKLVHPERIALCFTGDGDFVQVVRALQNKGCRQMRPGSAFIEDLNRDVDVLEPIHVASLWTPFDLSILPATSSLLSIGQHVRLPVLLHPLMLWDRRSLDQVARLLETD